MFLTFLFTIIVGIILVIISLLSKKDARYDEAIKAQELANITELNNRLSETVQIADNTLNEMNSMSSLVLDEMEGKYKELLYLYQLIDEKRLEVERLYAKKVREIERVNVQKIIDKSTKSTYVPKQSKLDKMEMNTPLHSVVSAAKDSVDEALAAAVPEAVATEAEHNTAKQGRKEHADIIDLHNSGMAISDIAKKLNIGQGEIKLIIELNKSRG